MLCSAAFSCFTSSSNLESSWDFFHDHLKHLWLLCFEITWNYCFEVCWVVGANCHLQVAWEVEGWVQGSLIYYISRNSLFQSPCCSQALSNIDQHTPKWTLECVYIHYSLHYIKSIGIPLEYESIHHLSTFMSYSCLCNRTSFIHINLLIY